MVALAWLGEQLEADGNDLLREMVRSFAEGVMGAEAEVLCGARYGEVSPERGNDLRGVVAHFRSRPLDAGPYTYVWADALAIKVREGGRIVKRRMLLAV